MELFQQRDQFEHEQCSFDVLGPGERTARHTAEQAEAKLETKENLHHAKYVQSWMQHPLLAAVALQTYWFFVAVFWLLFLEYRCSDSFHPKRSALKMLGNIFCIFI